LEPTETGINALMTGAARTGSFYDQAAAANNEIASLRNQEGNRIGSAIQVAGAQAVDYVDHQQINQGGALFAQKLEKLDAEWNAVSRGTNPNDTSIRQKFLDGRVTPELESALDGFTTEKSRDFAQAYVNKIQDHFIVKTAADQASRAKEAITQNLDTLTTSLSNAAVRDPSTLKTALDLIDHTVTASVGTSPAINALDTDRISGELKLNAQRTVVKAAAIGDMAIDPVSAMKKYSSPEFGKYLNGADLKQLEEHQQTVIRAQHTDENYQRLNQQRAQQEASDQREGQYIAKLHDDDPAVSGTVTAKAIANDFTLTREARERMIGIVERETKPDTSAAVSAQSSVQIMKMIRDPNADPQTIRNAILEARVKDPGTPGSITKADMADLQKQLDDVKTPQGAALAADRNEFLKQYGPTVDPEMKLGNPTPLGAQGLYRLEKDARRQEQQLRSQGIDPHSLYDPNSQYFLGKPDRIDSYRPSLADKTAFEARLKADKTRPPAVQPGQSVNLTGNGGVVTGIQALVIPTGMSPGDAMKWAKDQGAKSGDKVKLPDGRMGTVQ
jgi:hypothetical protein